MTSDEKTQSDENNRATSGSSGTKLTHSARARSGSVQYELVSYRGEIFGPYDSVDAVVAAARAKWPDQEQDEDRTGAGWDVQVAGCE